MSVLTIKNLKKYYGDFLALDDVSLHVQAGEVYGFIGRNGAGKTTTINTALGLIEKDEGTVLFNGNVVEGEALDFKRQIGYVPDVPEFPRYMRADELLGFVYDAYELPAESRQARIDVVMGDVGLAGVTKRIGGFSRGMKQRLAIAQALIHEPTLLIMDEPTSALDPLGRKQVLDIVASLKGSLTVFYSTHILDDAERVCDRIGLIENGKMVLEDTVKNIVVDPLNRVFHMQSDVNPELMLIKLQEKPFVETVSIENEGLDIAFANAETIRAFFAWSVEQNITIKRFIERERTLEDVFVEVLHENNA